MLWKDSVTQQKAFQCRGLYQSYHIRNQMSSIRPHKNAFSRILSDCQKYRQIFASFPQNCASAAPNACPEFLCSSLIYAFSLLFDKRNRGISGAVRIPEYSKSACTNSSDPNAVQIERHNPYGDGAQRTDDANAAKSRSATSGSASSGCHRFSHSSE